MRKVIVEQTRTNQRGGDLLHFTKMQGAGNDFVLLDGFCANFTGDYGAMAQKICDRHFGVGADGLVLLSPTPAADAEMHIFNPDGSEAEMCGNALRCAALYLYEHKIVSGQTLRIKTKAGTVVPTLIFVEGAVKAVKVDLGCPRPVSSPGENQGKAGVITYLKVGGEEVRVTCVSLGNPHAVLFVPTVAAAPVSTLGPQIEHHPFFPHRTNVEFVEVLGKTEIKVRVWERGAGETLACGTGACAAVVAGVLDGKMGTQVKVFLPGGELEVEWGEDNHLYLTGPAEKVFEGYL